MRLNAGLKTPQLSILRATVAFNAIPEKERLICADIYRPGKLINSSTSGEAFIDSHLQWYVYGKLEDGGSLYIILYTYRHFVLGSSVKRPLLGLISSSRSRYEKRH